jgi:myo-inositol 2-dehydrogenase / D-chiro-inositol 1-dehydrogenase
VTVRIAVIGAGIMGADHVTTLHRFVRDAQVQAVADVDLSRAQLAVASIDGSTGGVRSKQAWATDDPLAAIADPEVDAVLIASHDSTHPELVLAAVHAGKPVLCEKPLTVSLDESLRLGEAVGADAGLVSLGFMRRFDPGYTRLKAAIDSRALGRTLLIHCVSRGVSSAPGTTSEGAVIGSAVHELDVVPWLLGSPVVEVSWQAPLGSSRIDGSAGVLHDPQLILLRTADGVLTSCETFLNAGYGYDIRCEVVGESGAISLAEPARVLTDRLGGRTVEYGADWRPRFAEAYRLELQAWVDGLESNGLPGELAGFEDGVRASRVAQAVIESMHDGGRFITVSEGAER